MELTVKVATPQGVLTFSCEAHHTAAEDERLIEVEFYKKNSVSHTVPEGDHYELELTTPVWETITDSRNHVHQNSQTGRRFVCVTNSVPTPAAAKKIFEIWCLAIAHTISTEEDLFPLLNANDLHSFEEKLQLNGIELVEA
ncbi:MAG: hypothetical protein WD200_03320 [Candidatus Andersenbacteria bacterium]